MVLMDFPKLEAFDRISQIPFVEYGFEYASGFYFKIKRSNLLFAWSLDGVEGSLQKVATVTLPLVPLEMVDNILCKTLNEVEQRVPAINYQPEQIMNMTKDMLSKRIVQPVLKRADSVKQFSVKPLSKYSELAVSSVDSALNKADEYVDQYLPDSTDSPNAGTDKGKNLEGSTTIQHAQRFTKKLQRRLTKRTLAEARALKKTGQDIAECFYFLLDLLVNNPKEFANTMIQIWANLSEDEPENQIPPANIDQLLALVVRESARRFVHIVNYGVKVSYDLPGAVVHLMSSTKHQALYWLDFFFRTTGFDEFGMIALGKIERQLMLLIEKVDEMYSLIFRKSNSTASHEIKSPAKSRQPIHSKHTSTHTSANEFQRRSFKIDKRSIQ